MTKLFVAYVVQTKENENYHGDCVVAMNYAPETSDDVEMIRDEIKRSIKANGFDYRAIFITNWIVMGQ